MKATACADTVTVQWFAQRVTVKTYIDRFFNARLRRRLMISKQQVTPRKRRWKGEQTWSRDSEGR